MDTKTCTRCRKEKVLGDFLRRGNGTSCYCRDCEGKKSRLWYQNNKKRHLRRAYERYKEIRNEIIDILGSKCFNCPVVDRRVLCIDHIDGSGARERKNLGGNGLLYKMFKDIKSGKHNYQLLCANCNWIKALENGELKKKNASVV